MFKVKSHRQQTDYPTSKHAKFSRAVVIIIPAAMLATRATLTRKEKRDMLDKLNNLMCQYFSAIFDI